MTIKNKQVRIKAIQEEIENLDNCYATDSELVKKRDEIRKREEAIHKEIQPKVETLYNEMRALQNDIEKERDSKVLTIPESVKEFIKRLCAGTDYGPKGFIVKWVSPKERFIIATNPGHTFWASMMEPQKYASSHHYLFDIDKLKEESKQVHGSMVKSLCEVKWMDGRLSKEVFKEWRAIAEKEESNG